jgi:hypothetical protein
VAFHKGIVDSSFPPYLRESGIEMQAVRASMREYSVKYVFAGDFHTSRQWECGIVQCGALCPTGFQDSGLNYGHLWYVDDDGRLEKVSIPGPRFVATIEDARAAQQAKCQPFLRLRAKPGDPPQDIERWKALGIEIETVLDDSASAEAVQDAAQRARTSNTILDALHAYVERMPIPPNADRQEIFKKSKELLEL